MESSGIPLGGARLHKQQRRRQPPQLTSDVIVVGSPSLHRRLVASKPVSVLPRRLPVANQCDNVYSEAWNAASRLFKARHLHAAAAASPSSSTRGSPILHQYPYSTYRRASRSDEPDAGRFSTSLATGDVDSYDSGQIPERAILADERSAVRRHLTPDYTTSSDGTMKIEYYGLGNGDGGPPVVTSSSRRSSQDLGSWIDKYQKSDHHVDRLVRTVVQYETATGQQFPGTLPSCDCDTEHFTRACVNVCF
jgi:hypothetical protein